MYKHSSDVLIIGSGIAALQTALYASEKRSVTIVTKTSMRSSNSYLAQGGVAVANAADDNWNNHLMDTLEAGRYHNKRNRVATLVREGVAVINELIDKGMPFDRDACHQFIYGLEGAHSKRRILHSQGDSTGRQLIEFLWKKVQSTDVVLKENEQVLQLLLTAEGECIGAVTRDEWGALHMHYASEVVLATGGSGGLYLYSTNGANATGDGFALALKAGAILKDMEFIQFHPTGLYIDGKVRGLVSEAVRGEGARLVNENGERIMRGVHELEDLAPRHVVAQTIYQHMEQGEIIYLDISMIDYFSDRFPTVTALCEQYGLCWQEGFIPVAPASHFVMGGVETDEHGQTSVKHLYAVGEVAYTGVHGANRLASNSLLEGLVFGKRVGCYLQEQPVLLRLEEEQIVSPVENMGLPSPTDLQQKMFQYAGIVRDENGLQQLASWLQQFEIKKLVTGSFLSFSKEEVTTAFMLLTAMTICHAALLRKESRGAHHRSDFTEESNLLQDTVSEVWKSNVEGRLINEQVKA